MLHQGILGDLFLGIVLFELASYPRLRLAYREWTHSVKSLLIPIHGSQNLDSPCSHAFSALGNIHHYVWPSWYQKCVHRCGTWLLPTQDCWILSSWRMYSTVLGLCRNLIMPTLWYFKTGWCFHVSMLVLLLVGTLREPYAQCSG